MSGSSKMGVRMNPSYCKSDTVNLRAAVEEHFAHFGLCTPKGRRSHALWRGVIGLVLAAMLGPLCQAETTAVGRGFVFGYAAGWVPVSETIAALPHVDRLMFMDLSIGSNGQLSNPYDWPAKWNELRTAIRMRGIPVDVVLTQFSAASFNTLFGSVEHVRQLESNVLRLAADTAVSGIHLDVEIMEPVNVAAGRRYREFVLSLSKRLKAMQPFRLLSVFFYHGADKRLYDAATLAVVDHVVVQGYDAHWLETGVTGPVAPLFGSDQVTWVNMLAAVQSMGVPPQRILMGFPTYGYEWRVNPCSTRGARVGPGVTTAFGRVHLPEAPSVKASVMERVLAHGAQYDADTGSAHYQFAHPDGGCVVGWFEDWWTLQRKLDWLQKYRLAGLAVFPLGYDNGELVGLAARRLRFMPLPESVKLDAQ